MSFLASLAIGVKVLSKEHTEVKTGIAAQEQERVERAERKEEKRRSKRASRVSGDLERGVKEEGVGGEAGKEREKGIEEGVES